jgi:hypothetical protein
MACTNPVRVRRHKRNCPSNMKKKPVKKKGKKKKK